MIATKDFSFRFHTTAAAESAEVTALTEAGRIFLGKMFGAGALAVTLPHTKAVDLRRFFAQHGLSSDSQ